MIYKTDIIIINIQNLICCFEYKEITDNLVWTRKKIMEKILDKIHTNNCILQHIYKDDLYIISCDNANMQSSWLCGVNLLVSLGFGDVWFYQNVSNVPLFFLNIFETLFDKICSH